jgi:hypothetical protein
MKATLIIPTPPTFRRKYKLAARRKSAGLRVRRATHLCRVLSGKIFRDLRDVLGARIETDNAAWIVAALRLGSNEPGIIQLPQPA